MEFVRGVAIGVPVGLGWLFIAFFLPSLLFMAAASHLHRHLERWAVAVILAVALITLSMGWLYDQLLLTIGIDVPFRLD